MKRDTSKLEKHLERHPTDANSVISLLKIKSDNYIYDLNLESKMKHEKFKSFKKNKKGNGNETN